MICAWCSTPLVDNRGRPRWEMVTVRLAGRWTGQVRSTRAPAVQAFVCLERCPPPTRRIVTRYAQFGDRTGGCSPCSPRSSPRRPTMADVQVAMFDTDTYQAEPPPKVSPDVRRRQRQAATLARGWWPGCTDHTYGEPRLSDDAARFVPTVDGDTP